MGFVAYLTVCTWPDISFAVSVLSRQLHDPSYKHLSLVKRVVKYVLDTRAQSILSSSASSATLTAYADLDWAGCHETRRSTTGFVITENNTLIFWQCKRQLLVALSFSEAVYLSASQWAKQIVWLRRFFGKPSSHRPIFDDAELPPTPILTDNTGAVARTTRPSISERKEHIDLKCHQIEDLYKRGGISFQKMFSSK